MLLRMFRYLSRREWGMIVLSLLFILGQVWLDLRIPEYMAQITRLAETPGSSLSALWQAGGSMLALSLLSMLASVCTGFLSARVSADYSMRLRGLVFDKVTSFGLEELNHFSVASLITRSTNDVSQVQMVVAAALQIVVKAPIMAVWAIAKISSKQWQWTLTTAVCVLLMLAVYGVMFRFAVPRFKVMQTLTDNVNRITREHLTGLRVVRAYNAEVYQAEKFGRANQELTATGLYVGRLFALLMPLLMLVMNGMNLAIYWLGAYIIRDAAPALRVDLFADMVVFSSYAMLVVASFEMLVMVFLFAPRALVSAKRIMEVLAAVPSVTDGPGAAPAETGTLEFRGVSFRYPGAASDMLEDISFTARRGETVAIIGATGSGKTTLVNLIPRFYDVTRGQVLVDGVNVKEYAQQALRAKLGFAAQKALLFSGTVTSNVAYGQMEQATEEAVRAAVSLAQSQEFVEALEDGYQAHIAQGGSNLSGGQKQRLSIARAVYRRPEILIFDDAFSALDYRTDRALRAALKRETAGTTCLIVAQRIGTILDADRILVLEKGRIVGAGDHRTLLKTCPIYREIALSQLTEEELNNA